MLSLRGAWRDNNRRLGLVLLCIIVFAGPVDCLDQFKKSIFAEIALTLRRHQGLLRLATLIWTIYWCVRFYWQVWSSRCLSFLCSTKWNLITALLESFVLLLQLEFDKFAVEGWRLLHPTWLIMVRFYQRRLTAFPLKQLLLLILLAALLVICLHFAEFINYL